MTGFPNKGVDNLIISEMMHPPESGVISKSLLYVNAKKESKVGVPLFKVAGVSFVTFALILGLSGCGAEPAPEPSMSVPPSEAPEVPIEPSADPNADALFTITANVRAVDGRTIGITMTAHTPVASTDKTANDIRAQFLSVCSAGNGALPIDEEYLSENGSTLMRISLDSSAPDLTFVTPVQLMYGSPYFAQSASGSGINPIAGGQVCFNGFGWAKSGKARGVADFENSDGVPDLTQWHFGRYGFAVDPASGATIEACRVTLSELAMKDDFSDAPGWDPSHAGDGISCLIGYVGE